MRRPIRLGLVLGGLLSALLGAATPALACSGPLRPVADIAGEVDRIVIGSVLSRTLLMSGDWTYQVAVDRVLKGPHPGAVWQFDAGGSECGMPRLEPDTSVAIEMYDAGRISPGLWFYAWRVDSKPVTDLSGFHEEEPATLDELIALYRVALPDTATVRSPQAEPPGALIPLLAAVLAALVAWRSFGAAREA